MYFSHWDWDWETWLRLVLLLTSPGTSSQSSAFSEPSLPHPHTEQISRDGLLIRTDQLTNSMILSKIFSLCSLSEFPFLYWKIYLR